MVTHGRDDSKARSGNECVEPRRSERDPATLCASPVPDDLAAWKRTWEADEADSERKVRTALKRFDPVVHGQNEIDHGPVFSRNSWRRSEHLQAVVPDRRLAHDHRGDLGQALELAHATGVVELLVADAQLLQVGQFRSKGSSGSGSAALSRVTPTTRPSSTLTVPPADSRVPRSPSAPASAWRGRRGRGPRGGVGLGGWCLHLARRVEPEFDVL